MSLAADFVELSHFGAASVDLGGWTLATGAGQWRLPPRTPIAPGKPLVVTGDAAAFRRRYGQAVNLLELTGFRTHPDQDVVTLEQAGHTVDWMAWGGSRPGWRPEHDPLAVLCRTNPGKDTNTVLDWAPATKPTPGIAGCGR